MPFRRRSGFSIVEVLIATAVLAIGILGVMSALLFGLRASDHGKRVGEATNYARQMMEYLRIKNAPAPGNNVPNITDADSDRRALNDPPFDGASGYTMMENHNYRRNIQVTYLPPNNKLARIQIRVYWDSGGVERFVEFVTVAGGF